MGMDAGTKTLHERDSPALAVRYSTRTRTPPERGENRTDEDPNQGGQQRGVISDPVAECVGRRQHPLADRYIGNDAIYEMGCRIRHSPASTRRAYASDMLCTAYPRICGVNEYAEYSASVAAVCDFPEFCPDDRRDQTHLLRHSSATAMLRYGSSLDVIGAVLRHRSIESTAHYAKVDFALLRSVVQPWPGKGGS